MTVKLTQNFLANARGIIFKDSASVTWSINANTNEITATGSGGGGTGGNPTAKVGLTAVNGTSSNFIRSDGAPPIDQNIAPTWTSAHTFAPTAGGPATTTEVISGVATIAEFGSADTGGGYIELFDFHGSQAAAFVGYGANTITGAAITDLCLAGGASGNVIIGTANGGGVGTKFGSAGGIIVGAPTGGNKGAGTINVATGYYVNGVAVSGGSVINTFDQSGGATQTYNVPANANWVRVICIGGGGGGQAGTPGAAGTSRSGGGGGGGGGISFQDFRAADLGSTVTITFTNAATGGNGGTGSGGSGVTGSHVHFGNFLFAYGGSNGSIGSGGLGSWQVGTAGGNSAAGGAGGPGTNTSGTGALQNNMLANTGGGAGGGINASNVAQAGGAGGATPVSGSGFIFATAAAGGTVGAGQNGTASIKGSASSPSFGGGGGAGNASAAAGAGGSTPTAYGSGGGGGGASLTGQTSGVGGQGGYAACICIAF